MTLILFIACLVCLTINAQLGIAATIVFMIWSWFSELVQQRMEIERAVSEKHRKISAYQGWADHVGEDVSNYDPGH